MRIIPAVFILFVTSPLLADEPKKHRGLPYTDSKNERQTLDVYAAAKGKDQPVVLWIHGGGWRAGDKGNVQKKPQAFVDKGYIFVSTNYRFVPDVTAKGMAGDIAKAVRWVHDHAREYGGDPKSIFVMGHSAGAHLAALICTDDRYLKAEGLSLSIIKGCVPVDAAVYDVKRQIDGFGASMAIIYSSVFGKDESSQKEFSPIAHVSKGKNIPPFLILHVADRADSKAQSRMFGDKLKEAGVSAEVVAAEGTTHGTINANLGMPADKPTLKMWEFMSAALLGTDAPLAELKKLGARITLDDRNRVIGVNLGERRVTDAELVHLKTLQHLQELDLTRTKITGAGLTNIKGLTSLKKLFLTDTRVDDAGISHLKELKNLELIGLSGTLVRDAGLEHLHELTGLKQFYCIGTGITDAGVEKLQRALPKCRITR
jgi:acetyl esterase/lipase